MKHANGQGHALRKLSEVSIFSDLSSFNVPVDTGVYAQNNSKCLVAI